MTMAGQLTFAVAAGIAASTAYYAAHWAIRLASHEVRVAARSHRRSR